MYKVNMLIQDINDIKFLISNIILSQKKEFSTEDILNEIEKFKIEGINKSHQVKAVIVNLRDSGLISERYPKYLVC